MEDEDLIRQQMEETRTSLTEKLETLETKVAETVEGATTAVSETVTTVKDSIQDTVCAVKDTVQDTVATVKDSVHNTVASVKDTLHDGVEAVKSAFDVPELVRQHPWPMLGASVAAGFVLERLVGKKAPGSSAAATHMAEMMSEASTPAGPQAGSSGHRHGRGHHSTNGGSKKPARTAGIMSMFGPELNKLKSLGLSALLGVTREMVSKGLPPEMGGQLRDIIDNVTRKLGGEPLAGATFANLGAGNERAETERQSSAESLRDRGVWQRDR